MLATNDVISSYKDFSLTDDKEKPESVFPASLQGVILGPNMKNVEINRLQLEELAIEKGVTTQHPTSWVVVLLLYDSKYSIVFGASVFHGSLSYGV